MSGATALPAPHRARTVLSSMLVVALCLLGVGVVAAPASALTKVETGSAYGDFEDPRLTPVGWSVSTSGPNQVNTSSTVAASGIRSLYVSDSSTVDPVTVLRKLQRVTPGSEYTLQAYTFSKSGGQRLAMRFVDADNKILSRIEVPTPDATMVWSRVVARAKAPVSAVAVTAEISSTKTGRGVVWWDAVEVLVSDLANSGFEKVDRTTPTPSPAPDWTISAPPGAVAQVTGDTVLGRYALKTEDTSTTDAVTLRTAPKRIFPGVSQDLRIWLKPESGTFTGGIRFYDASMQEVSSSIETLRKSNGRWNLVKRSLVSPTNAIWATVEIGSSTGSTGTSLWDAIDLRSSSDTGVHSYTAGASVEPVKQSANAAATMAMVVGGRPKMLGIVSGSPAELQVVDIQTGSVERRLVLGEMLVGWALTQGKDGNVYLGGNDGHVWRWTPGATSVVDLGRATTTATTVWDLETAPDGQVWGVSYPEAQLWSYNPATARFTSPTTVAPAQEYARSLAIIGSSLFVGVGSTDPEIVEVSRQDRSIRSTITLPSPVTSGNITELDARGRFLAVKTPPGVAALGTSVAGERRLYDTVERTWDVAANYSVQRPSEADADGDFYYVKYRQLARVGGATGATTVVGPTAVPAGRDKLLVTGTLDGVTGTWLVNWTPGSGVGAVEVASLAEKTFPVDFSPTALQIKTLAKNATGYFAGGFGAPSLTSVGTDLSVLGSYAPSSSAADTIGEVEGSITNGAYEYVGTYTNSKIFRYDLSQPWSDGTNPRLIANLGETSLQDRPLAWATSGERTFFGTLPKYGRLGGSLGIIDDNKSAPRVIDEPVSDQSVVSLAASGSVVFGGTSRWGGLGATPTQTSARIFALDATTGKVLWSVAPQTGVEAYGAMLVTPSGSLWAASGPTLFELDPANGQVLRRVELQKVGPQPTPTFRNASLDFADNLLYLTAAGRVYVVDLASMRVDVPVKEGVTAFQIAARPGRFVVPMGTELREFLVR
ncbi:PQQ-like beta-propeller repeat protein [Phycicoccus jejuensis]|uniref:hypothetical protein n=1 Tax=Phycicoccus jejuensis TaxID=367299 RepID=UPI00384F7416